MASANENTQRCGVFEKVRKLPKRSWCMLITALALRHRNLCALLARYTRADVILCGWSDR